MVPKPARRCAFLPSAGSKREISAPPSAAPRAKAPGQGPGPKPPTRPPAKAPGPKPPTRPPSSPGPTLVAYLGRVVLEIHPVGEAITPEQRG